MLCRAESRAQMAMESIRAEVPGAKLEFLPFDLCNLTSCRKAAEMFLQREVKLHAVVANAGIVSSALLKAREKRAAGFTDTHLFDAFLRWPPLTS